MRRFYAFLPIILILGLITWRIAEKRAGDAEDAGSRATRSKAPASVATAVAATRDIVGTFEGSGNVEAPLNVKLSPKLTGRLEFLQAQEGDRVHKGQVLARLDPRQVEAEVHRAQAAVAEAQYRLAQAKLTQNSNEVGVNSQVKEQRAAVASAKADYAQVKRNYESQLAAAAASVTDAEQKVESANAAIGNAEAAIGSAEANLENARTKYNRVQELYKQGFIAAQDVDDAKATVSVQQAAVEVARGQLRSTTAQRDSAIAQKQSAVQQAAIVKNKGTADIEAARAKLEQAKASSEYAVANTSQKAAYSQSLAALQAAVQAAQADLRSAQAQRADTVLVSPLDGFVTARYADPGAMVSAGQAVLGVQFMRQVWVAISVPEETLPKLHIGQAASVSFDAYPGRKFAGSIIQINPSADPEGRQFTVRVIMDNHNNLLRPGMFAHVAIETERLKNMTVVPTEAIQRDRDGEYAMVVGTDAKAQRRSVVTGASDAEGIAIVSGVRPGDKVVTMSASPVKDGQAVRTGGNRKGGSKGQGRQ